MSETGDLKALIYPVFIPQMGCTGRCIFCDQNKISGLEHFDWTAELPRVIAFLERNRSKPRQIAFYGGSFTGLDIGLRESWLTDLKPHLSANTTIRISTRPDLIDDATLQWCLGWNIHTIELGIQDFCDHVLIASRRQYNFDTVVSACRLIRQSGLELGVQLMPGLPGSNQASIATNMLLLKEILPEYARFYPTIVIRGTPLADLWTSGQYVALELNTAIAICADYAELCESEGIKAIKFGLPSTLSTESILAGPYHPAFGELVRIEMLIRQIQQDRIRGRNTQLSRRQILLLTAHDHYGMKILEERHISCT